MRSIRLELSSAVRAVRGSPRVAALAVTCLSLGIGATTAMFSVFDAVMLRPLPFAQPDRLALVMEKNAARGWDEFVVSYPNLADWQAQAASFESLGGYRPASYPVTGVPEPERASTLRISAGFLETLGVGPRIGRPFLPDEYQPGGPPAALISDAMWLRQFGRAPDAIGRTIHLDGIATAIVGVLQPGFEDPFGGVVDCVVPYAFKGADMTLRGARGAVVIGRLRDGVTIVAARAEMDAIGARLAGAHPQTNDGWGVSTTRLVDRVIGYFRPGMLSLVAAVGFLLLIACVNVSNLLLVRATARRREIGIRTALGASRWRIARQLFAESLVLAVAAAVLGVAFAYWLLRLSVALAPPYLRGLDEASLDPEALLFTIAITAGAALAAGLAPMLHLVRTDVAGALKEGAPASAGGAWGRRLRGGFVAVELAASMVLLLAAGLVVKEFIARWPSDPGFDPAGKVALRLTLGPPRYAGRAERAALLGEITGRIEAMPSVERVAAANYLPYDGFTMTTLVRSRMLPDNPFADSPRVEYRAVTANYFSAMGIRLLDGRAFTARDVPGAPGVCIAGDALRRRLWPNGSALGHRVSLRLWNPTGTRGADLDRECEIVGVVADALEPTQVGDPRPAIYVPYLQHPDLALSLVIEAETRADSVIPDLRARLRALDPDLIPDTVTTLESLIARRFAEARFYAVLMGTFAGIGLALAIVGIYGIMSYATEQRGREIGIRIALGAGRGDVLGLVLRQALVVCLAGLAVGLGGAALLARAMSALLWRVDPSDPYTFAGGAGLLGGAALLAAYVPARRAARVDPLSTLRRDS
jgi:putative ABC transport system permease protein